jgi:hypothetical protein
VSLLPAFGGRVLVALLGGSDDAVRTSMVDPDVATVTPNVHIPLDPGPTAGVLVPCPGL